MHYFKISFLLIFPLLISCHRSKNTDPQPVKNTLKILSVIPGSAIQSGVPTYYDVEVAYHYESGDSIEINIGFNSDQYGICPGNSEAYLIVSSQTVYAHTDTINFSVTNIAVNTGVPGSHFRCFANMARLPHTGASFSPILDDSKTISFE